VSSDPGRWPLVSVIVPTRGRPDLVRATISSVVGQAYPGRIECLVVHDQEPPDPALASPGTAERQVAVIANHRTPGLAGARNSGLAEATGEFIATCDDDDVWHPAKLQAQIGRLLDQPDLLLVGSGIRLMLPDGRIISWPARAERISQRLLLRNRVKELHSSTLAMRRDVFAKAGLYDEQTPNGYAEDYDFILRVARVGRIGAVATPLADIRKDSGSWWPGNAAPARADRVLAIVARPARAGAAVRGQRHRQVACVAARLPGAGPHRDRRGPQARAARCAAGWKGPGLAVGQTEEKRGDFHDVRAQGRTRTGPEGRPTCVPAGGHGDGAAAAAA
jgi:GT2 family glycosyltransferase